MFRSITRDGLPHCSVLSCARPLSFLPPRHFFFLSSRHFFLSSRHFFLSSRHFFLSSRHFSHPSSDTLPKHHPSNIPPVPPGRRKPTVAFGAGPYPRSTLSASKVPKFPLHKSSPLDPQPLNQVKESAKRDIEQAEAHGILSPPPPGANWFKRTLHKGIQLAKFYFRGVKLIFLRRREIAEIRARIRAGGSPLTRAEFRLIQTQKDDVNKVIPFVIIALLLEEVIPIIAIYAPSFLPSTCILPSQQERIQQKKYEKALSFAIRHPHLFLELKTMESPENYLPINAIRLPNAPIAISGLLGLSTLGFDTLRMHRIQRRLDFLAEDDRLLLQDKSHLSEKELDEALLERGLVVFSTSRKAKETKLKWWLTNIQSSDPSNASARRLALMIRNLAPCRRP